MISLVGTFVLVHGFSALLPPIPDDERTYYEIMNVPTNASQEDIRKAYKKLSLKLHPDKVAQRGGDAEEARVEYQHVQEAYAVLCNPSKKRRYDLLNKSPTRYQFVSTGLNPGAMYENLAKASCCDKSRLVFMALILCCIILLQPILICSKVNQDLRQEGVLYASTWVAILVPWWIAYGLVVVVHLVVFVLTKQVLFWVVFMEHACWFVGTLFLALRWDRTIIAWNYAQVFIPVYFALFLRWTHKILRLRQIAHHLQRMVTMDYIEQHVLQDGRTYQDLSEEEIHDLSQQYVLVHVPPSAASLVEEEEKIQASPEYEHAVDSYTEIMNGFISGILVGIPFLTLVICKVDGRISSSWWVVFIPIWVSLGLDILGSVYTCCCVPSIGEEVVGGNVGDGGEDEQEAETKDDDGFEDRKADSIFDSVEGSMKRAAPQDASASNEAPESTDATATATDNPKGNADNETKMAQAPASPKDTNGGTAVVENNSTNSNADANKEETKEPDVVEEIPTTPGNNEEEWSGIHIDDDMFREFESAYQEAEESAMEAQAKSQANCCSALFQLMMLCLLVGKLQQDYMRGENEAPGYNAFWILFPVFLVFGCALCTCACLIYTAGESEGFDHLVERATHNDDGHDEESVEETSPQAEEGPSETDATVASNTEGAEEAKEEHSETKEQDSEMHDLD